MACVPVNLPATTADYCNPDLNFGEVDKIYLGHDGQPAFAAWGVITEWTPRLDNDTLADLTLIRTLHVVGDKPAPEKTEIRYSQGRTTYGVPKHTVNVRVDETGDDNYALIQWLEENSGSQLRVWYQAGKYLYGGPEGILAKLDLSDIIPESDQELNTFNGTIIWEGFHPDRVLNPLA